MGISASLASPFQAIGSNDVKLYFFSFVGVQIKSKMMVFLDVFVCPLFNNSTTQLLPIQNNNH